jgi:hypothetical protein
MPDPNKKDDIVTTTPNEPVVNEVKPEAQKLGTFDMDAFMANLEKKIEEKFAKLMATPDQKIETPKGTDKVSDSKEPEDFDAKIAAYEKRKYLASLSPEDKAELAKIPGGEAMSVDQIQFFLSLAKGANASQVQKKSFPAIDNSVTGQGGANKDMDDYIKEYKKYEEAKLKRGK